jgi:hypothetical protein
MRFKLIVFFLVFILVSANHLSAVAPAAASNVLFVLGKDKNSHEFKEFKDVWHLDKQYENNAKGVKLYVNDLNEKVESVLLAGDNYKLDGLIFSKYSSGLPFDIAFNDNMDQLTGKLGQPEKLMGRNAFKFNKQNISFEVAYAGNDNGKISFIKCYYEIVKPVPQSPAVKQVAEIKKQPILLASMGPLPAEKHIPVAVAVKVPEADVVIDSKASPLKQAIMNVFKSYRESAFYSIKDDTRVDHNYWNYKYTYKTKLKIPGEKFNMLYSFPFSTSQLDFVSVLKEGDVFDKSFEQIYHQFEKQLSETFPAKDGWEVSRIPNKESKNIYDIEYRNDKYGAVVLDYCRNPKGKHIIYLRFLLFSN